MPKIKKPLAANVAKLSPSSKLQTPGVEHPVFCFRYLAKSYSISDCTNDQLVALVQQLERLSKLTWQEIRLSGRHAMGGEKLVRASIKGPIPDWVTEDVSFFLAFRFIGKMPFIAHRNGQIMHLIAIDHDFNYYPHS